MKLSYNTEFSSSAGNSVLINHILFDIGISHTNSNWLKLMQQAHAIFISHKHTDHLNLGTLKWIEKNYPLIPIYVNDDTQHFIQEKLDDKFANLKVVHNRDVIEVDNDKLIQIYKTKHEPDVKTMAYLVTMKDFTQFVFGTDFWDWNDLPQGKYDYFFIEANHDQNYKKVLTEIADLTESDIPTWLFHSSDRHGTKQASFDYYLKHRLSKQAHYIPLHKSSRFYDITEYQHQLIKIKAQLNHDLNRK